MNPLLFEPIHIKTVSLKNRIVISPMCQYSAVDGYANHWHLVHLGSRAIGGASLIIQEATAVSPEGRITAADLGIWDDSHIDQLKAITHFIASQNAVPGIQLAHAGRKASITAPWNGNQKVDPDNGGWLTVAPSAIGYHDDAVKPVALGQAGLDKVISDFRAAAKRALVAGYKVIEIHAAHGYLLHQFLSPLSNLRTDNYGGSFENRSRLLLEVIAAVQSEWPQELPLFVRISATDWADGGWDADDSVQLARLLKLAGVDAIDVSSGGLVSHQQIPVEPNYQVPFAARIKSETGIITGAVGLITEAQQSEEILQQQKADLIFFARQSLRDPNLALSFANDLGADVSWPNQYERAQYE